MSKGWKKGLSSKKLKERDEKKGTHYQAPGDRISYIKKGVIKMFVPKEGENRLRIIQPMEVEEIGFYGLEMHFHRSVGDEGEPLFGDYLCCARMKNLLRDAYKGIEVPNSCFVCKQQTSELWDDNADLAKTYYPDRRMWLFVQNLKADDPEEILLWSAPWTLHEEIVSRSSDVETGAYVDVSCPVEGVPVSFERTGMGKLTKYTNVQIFKKSAPLTEELAAQRIYFKDALVIPADDSVERAFMNLGVDDATATSDDEADSPENPEVEKEDVAPTTPDCFQKEYDKWEDCTDGNCKVAAECKEPKKTKKPKREELKKPKRTDANSSDADTKEAIRKKIKDAQK